MNLVLEVGPLKRTAAINWTVTLDRLKRMDLFTVDFREMSIAEPFAMLVFTSKLRQVRNRFQESRFVADNYRGKTYPAHMGFFKSFGLNFGNDPGQAPGSRTYIPITCIDTQDLYRESRNRKEHVGETIERHAQDMAIVLTQRKRGPLVNHLTFALRELMRNVVEHSEAPNIWVAGQYWPSLGKVELGILDEGIGIRKALRHNPHLSIDNDEQALLLACEPGISGKTYRGVRRTDDPWENSGFGLYMLRSISELGGNLTLLSGNHAIVMARQRYTCHEARFNGTAVGVTLYLNRLEDTTRLLPRLVREGEKRAGNNARTRILRASKVSAMVKTEEPID